MNATWNILNWNIRGSNSQDKWLVVANKIPEENYSIVCLQETKRESFDPAYIKNFCPRNFNKCEYVPSVGASGGLLVAWNDRIFQGECIFKNRFSLSIRLSSLQNDHAWILTNIYGPCETAHRIE